MRLIDANALREKAQYSNRFESDEQIVFLDDIDTAPTVDAVHVVRCKDCANYAGDGMYCAWGLLTGDMGYCHHGYVADRAAATEETGADSERKGGDE